jgi:hypothetical protein
MNTPKPFTRAGHEPSVLAVLDELDRMAAANRNDARRHLVEADRLVEMRGALEAKFRQQLTRQRKKVANGRT